MPATIRMDVSTLVLGMFLSGCANSLLSVDSFDSMPLTRPGRKVGRAHRLRSKWQDKQCVENCAPGDGRRVDFEQPVSWVQRCRALSVILTCAGLADSEVSHASRLH